MQISIIAAMAKNRVIGYQGNMPWHMPADLAHFKQITLNKPIIMGRKTFESIGKPLPQRRNIVISRQPDRQAEGIEVFNNIDTALSSCQHDLETMIIGGGNLYQQMLPLAGRLYLTFIDTAVEGDTFFPRWHETNWQQTACTQHTADNKNQHNYQFVTLERIT